jgi:predicted ribosome-associated RNA-binding protein Tma20
VKRLATLLVILLAGAAILAPVIMLAEPDPMPGDFVIAWNNQHYPVPVLWSLCASGALALLYFLYRR